MHAVLVKVSINDGASSEKELKETVVPRVSSAPGFVAGFAPTTEATGDRCLFSSRKTPPELQRSEFPRTFLRVSRSKAPKSAK